MIAWLLLAAFLAGLTAGGYGVYQFEEGAQARAEVALVTAQARIEKLSNEAEVEAATRLAARQAAYEQGEAKGREQAKTIYLKGATYVAANPQQYAGPQCSINNDGVRQLNDSITAVRAAAAADILGISVPGAGANNSANDNGGRAIPALPSQPSAASGVHREAPQPDSTPGIPGSVLQRPPKPTPTGK